MFSQQYHDSSVKFISDIDFEWSEDHDEAEIDDVTLTIYGSSYEDYDGYGCREECKFCFDNNLFTKDSLSMEFCNTVIMSAVDSINESLSKSKLHLYSSNLYNFLDSRINKKDLSDVKEYTCFMSGRVPDDIILSHSNKRTQITYNLGRNDITCNAYDNIPSILDIKKHIKEFAYADDGKYFLAYYNNLKSIME